MATQQTGTRNIELTAAIMLNGSIHRAGSVVDVDGEVARNLLDRKKAVVADDDAPQRPRFAKVEATPK